MHLIHSNALRPTPSPRQLLHTGLENGEHTMAPPPWTVCKYYLQGTCRFGDKCRYRHNVPGTPTVTLKVCILLTLLPRCGGGTEGGSPAT